MRQHPMVPDKAKVLPIPPEKRFLIHSIHSIHYQGYLGLEYFPLLPCPETLVKTRSYLFGK